MPVKKVTAEKTAFDTLAPGDETLDYPDLDYSTLDWDRLTNPANEIEVDAGWDE